ncbi:MAG: hypothetical protein K8S27_05840 [Candidatus Omnitrophica bacterium]|nr:hypothetical protein [Candidatus Omnitrophota bacterium]
MGDNKNKYKELISCRIAAQLLSEKIDHSLPITKELKLKAHMAICKTYRLCESQIIALRKAFVQYFSALTQHPVSQNKSLTSTAKERIKKAIRRKAV